MTQFLYIDHILNEYKCVVNKYFLIDFYEKYVVTPGTNYFYSFTHLFIYSKIYIEHQTFSRHSLRQWEYKNE